MKLVGIMPENNRMWEYQIGAHNRHGGIHKHTTHNLGMENT